MDCSMVKYQVVYENPVTFEKKELEYYNTLSDAIEYIKECVEFEQLFLDIKTHWLGRVLTD